MGEPLADAKVDQGKPTEVAARRELSETGDAEARATLFKRAGAHSDYLCARLAQGRILVKTEDHHIGRHLFTKGGRGDIKVLGRSVMTVRRLFGDDAIAGRTFVDVGANIGTTTVSALLGHPFAKSLSLEPEPENFLTLRLNLVLNGVDDRGSALQVAASNVSGELDLVVDRSRSGKHWIATPDGGLEGVASDKVVTKVRGVTLDSLADDGAYDPAATGLLWMDAENHEAQILEGASHLTALGVPVLFEWDPKGLAKRGDSDKLYSLVEEHYTHYAKMRAGDGGPRFQLRPATELRDPATAEEHFTDILIVRLRPSSPQRAAH